MELMLPKWIYSYVSDTYGFALWFRNIVRKNNVIAMPVRAPPQAGFFHAKTLPAGCRESVFVFLIQVWGGGRGGAPRR